LHQHGFILGDTIGVGGYSKVKSGKRVRDGAKVAIKVIDKRKAPAGYLAKFLPREIDALRAVHHPNIVSVYGACAHASPVHVCM